MFEDFRKSYLWFCVLIVFLISVGYVKVSEDILSLKSLIKKIGDEGFVGVPVFDACPYAHAFWYGYALMRRDVTPKNGLYVKLPLIYGFARHLSFINLFGTS